MDDDPVTPRWWWSIGPPPLITEDDVGICDDGYGGTAWWPVMDGSPYWSLASFSPETLTASEYAAPIPVQYALQNTPPNGANDGQVTATSDLFLYTVHFHHPDYGSIPRKAGDRSVNVGCCLMPRNVPAAWINRIELTIWDPATPSHKRVISGPSGQAWISTMWDGKLHENGVSGTAFYTQASDVFMSATAYWNVSNPPKPWETTPDEFNEARVAFITLSGIWVNSTPYHFDDQGVTVGGGPGSYPLIALASSQADFPARISWTMDPALADITEEQRHTHGPIYIWPYVPCSGNMSIRLEKQTPAGWEDTGISAAQIVTIFGSHLGRDRTNFKDGFRNDVFYMYSPRKGSDTISNTQEPGTIGPLSFNCHASSSHAYNGTKLGDWNENPAVVENWTTCTKQALEEGDICRFTGNVDHSTTCVGGNAMWGANNNATAIWDTVDIDAWLQEKRSRGLTVSESYYKNPRNM